jgi:hypothetical protein
MKYVLLIYSDENRWENVSEEEQASIIQEYYAYSDEIDKAGAAIGGNALQTTSSATSVRVRDGEQLVTDGPFAETKEQLGGFYVVDVDSLDEAIQWAAKIPSARFGTVEIRPVMVFDREAVAS